MPTRHSTDDMEALAPDAQARRINQLIAPDDPDDEPVAASSSVPYSLHSRLAGASAMRAGLTTLEGAVVSPTASSSIRYYGNSPAM